MFYVRFYAWCRDIERDEEIVRNVRKRVGCGRVGG